MNIINTTAHLYLRLAKVVALAVTTGAFFNIFSAIWANIPIIFGSLIVFLVWGILLIRLFLIVEDIVEHIESVHNFTSLFDNMIIAHNEYQNRYIIE